MNGIEDKDFIPLYRKVSQYFQENKGKLVDPKELYETQWPAKKQTLNENEKVVFARVMVSSIRPELQREGLNIYSLSKRGFVCLPVLESGETTTVIREDLEAIKKDPEEIVLLLSTVTYLLGTSDVPHHRLTNGFAVEMEELLIGTYMAHPEVYHYPLPQDADLAFSKKLQLNAALSKINTQLKNSQLSKNILLTRLRRDRYRPYREIYCLKQLHIT